MLNKVKAAHRGWVRKVEEVQRKIVVRMHRELGPGCAGVEFLDGFVSEDLRRVEAAYQQACERGDIETVNEEGARLVRLYEILLKHSTLTRIPIQ